MPAQRAHLLLVALAAVALAAAAEATAAGCPTLGVASHSQTCTSQATTAASVAAVRADLDVPGSIGESLSLAQRVAKRQSLQALQLRQPVAFIKTHKTGGSTMTNILNRFVLHQKLMKVFPNDGQVINWPAFRKTMKPKHQFDVVCNHQMFDEHAVRAYLKPKPFIFSVVREPVAMTDSLFRYSNMKQGGPPRFLTWASRLHHMKDAKAKYANPLARDLGWYSGIDIRYSNPSESVFKNDNNETAIRNFILDIDRAMDMVFLTEHYDEGLVFLKRKLKLKIDDVMYLRMKVSTESAEDIPPPTPKELTELKEFLHVDLAIYDYFSKRFWSQWNAFGEAELLPDLEALKQRNKKLEVDCAALPPAEKLCPPEFMIDSLYFNRMLLAMQNEGIDGNTPKDIVDHLIG